MLNVSCQFCGMTVEVKRAISLEGIGYACCNRHAILMEGIKNERKQREKTGQSHQGFPQIVTVPSDAVRAV